MIRTVERAGFVSLSVARASYERALKADELRRPGVTQSEA